MPHSSHRLTHGTLQCQEPGPTSAIALIVTQVPPPACQPRRWVSDDGDPTNQRGPWHTVDVALNLIGKIVEEKGFYETSAGLPRSGELDMVVTFEGLDEEDAKA